MSFALLAAAATSGLTVPMDTRLIQALVSNASAPLTTFMRAASWLATGGGAIPAAVLLAALLHRRGARRAAWLYIGACLSGWALNVALKELTRRNRPMGVSPILTDAGFYSFPSGHTMLATLVFGFGALLLARTMRGVAAQRTAGGIAGAVVLLVSVSRVYLGAHWPSDVLGGLLAGAGWAAVCLVACERWVPRRARAALVEQ